MQDLNLGTGARRSTVLRTQDVYFIAETQFRGSYSSRL